MLRAGDFRELAVFETQAISDPPDEYGRAKGAWSELLTEGGNLRETPGRELLAAGSMEANATATLLVRYSASAAAVTARDRVKVRGAYWNIVSAPIMKPGRPPLLEFVLKRGVAI